MRASPVTLLALAALAPPLVAQTAARDSLDSALRAQIAAIPGAEVGLYFSDLGRADSFALDADRRFHAASTMKVAVMVQVFRDADSGLLDLHGRISVTNTFRSLADGSTFSVDAADDSDHSLYERIGRDASIADLVRLMITRSSNLATNILVDRVQPDRVRETMRALGADALRVLRGVEDSLAFRAGLNNTTTARALGAVLAAIANGEAASAAACGQMLEILRDTEDRDGILAGLPRGTRLAHKTGQITALRHDAGVVYVRGRARYVLVVLTRGIPETAAANHLIADLTSRGHAYAIR